jgi:hypothetical protein
MSMIAYYRRVTPTELAQLQANPESVEEFLFPEEAVLVVPDGLDSLPDDDREIDLDKSWHAIHFLLTGDAWEGDPPLRDAVLGGTELGEDLGYGPARYLTPTEVRVVSQALNGISADDLRSRATLQDLAAGDIYAFAPEQGEDSWEYITGNYERLVSFFAEASAAGDAMLLYMS